ncbi:MAG: CDP-diacylglycerol/serine O-phosphatidyltransferase, partial [Xanthobacteraceae bacterium]|nr:CDP-diacylglycerol/serine O-phosphatidyltransferase [Xanthobacteraceae bacterium]
PAWSGKRLGSRIPREQVMPLFVCVVLFVAVLVTWPWVMLSVLCIAYLAMLPFSALRYARLSRDYQRRLAAGPADIHAGASASDGENRPSHLN